MWLLNPATLSIASAHGSRGGDSGNRRDSASPGRSPIPWSAFIRSTANLFSRAFTLHKEQRNEIGGNVSPAQRILCVINKERRCNKFKKWEQGFTPKEHAEMDLIERDKARQDARDESARQFQAAQAELADQRHNQALQAASDRESANQSGQWKRTVVTLIAGGLITLAIGWLRDGTRRSDTATTGPQPAPTMAIPAK